MNNPIKLITTLLGLLLLELTCLATPYKISIHKENGLYFATNISINNIPINGRFLIDTGTEVSVINSNIAELTNLSYKKKVTKYADGTNMQQIIVGEAVLNISLGELVTPKHKVDIWDNNNLDIVSVPNVVGIIEGDILRKYICKLTESSLYISTKLSDFSNIDEFSKLNIIYKDNPFIEVKFGRPIATSLFDTGYNGFLEVNNMFLDYIPIVNSIEGMGVVAKTILTKDTCCKAIKVEEFKIGNFSIKDPVAFVSNDKIWSIGTEFFNYFETIFDFPKKKMYLKQISKNFTSSHFYTYGFKFDYQDSDIIISFLWNNSSAEENGIKLGDKILTLNNFDIKKLLQTKSKCEISSLIRTELDKEFLDITIKDASNKIKVYHLNKQKII